MSSTPKTERVRLIFCPHCMAHTRRTPERPNRCGSCGRRSDRCLAAGCGARRLDQHGCCAAHVAAWEGGARPELVDGWTWDPKLGDTSEQRDGSPGPFRVRATGAAESAELRATRAEALAGARALAAGVERKPEP